MFSNTEIFLRFHTKPSTAQELVQINLTNPRKAYIANLPKFARIRFAQLPTDAQSDGKSVIS